MNRRSFLKDILASTTALCPIAALVSQSKRHSVCPEDTLVGDLFLYHRADALDKPGRVEFIPSGWSPSPPEAMAKSVRWLSNITYHADGTMEFTTPRRFT